MQLFADRVYRKSHSEASRRNYTVFIRLFMKFLGVNDADELTRTIKSGEINIVQSVNSWLDQLDKNGNAPKTQKNYYHGVKKFVEVVLPDVKVNWKKVDLPKQRKVEEDRRPTKEELREMLKHSNLTDQMIVLFLVSSGVRQGTLLKLRLENIDFESYEDVVVVKIPSRYAKQRVRYVTFLTPEAKETLKRYLDVRKRSGEKLTPKSLIVRRRVKDPTTGEYVFKPIRPRSLRARWERLLERSGKDQKERRWFTLHMHTLRKFFRTEMDGVVSTSYRERLMGHKGEYLDDAYFKPRIEELLNEYRKAIPRLTITEQIDETEMLKRQARIGLRQLAELGVIPELEFKRLEERLMRAKNMEEYYTELRKLKDSHFQEEQDSETMYNGNGKHVVVQGEGELLRRLENGWRLVQPLNHEKYLLQRS